MATNGLISRFSAFLLFPNLQAVWQWFANPMANVREQWRGASALSCEICRGITAFGRYYADALAPSFQAVVLAARRLAPSLFRYRFTTILATLVMAHDNDIFQRQFGQEKPTQRRDKVVVTKVTAQELSQIKSSAERCGMTRSDFIRARALNYRPRQRLSGTEVDGLRQLAACRTDMVNFANALHGLTDDEKVRLFRHQPTMLEWYEKVAQVTNHVTDFLQSAQKANSYPAGTTDEEAKEDAV